MDENQLGPAIERAGYKYVDGSGQGAGALWIPGEWSQDKRGNWKFTPDAEDARPYTQEQIANQMFPQTSPYLRANQPQDAKPDRITQGGVVYERGEDGEFRPLVAPQEASGGGGTAAQWAQLEQSRRAFEEQMRINNEAIARNARLDALAEQQQSWLQQKEALARADRKDEVAAATANQIATLQLNRDRFSFETQQAMVANQRYEQQMATDIAKFNAQGQMDTERFNRQMMMSVDQANNAAEAQRRRDIQDVNAQVGQLGQDTGNRGLWAAFATANRGFGQDNTALGQGQSFIDADSVQPLEGSLVEKQRLEASPARPYGYSPIAFNPIPGMTPGPLSGSIPGGQASGFNPNATTTWMPGSGPAGPSNVSNVANDGSTGTAGGNLVTINGQAVWAPSAPVAPPGSAMEHGGMVRGAFMAGDSHDGEENPEIVIPMGDGTMVVSLKGMAPDRIKEIKGRMAKFATGGLFDNLTGTPLSKQFLTDASQKFRKGTPWAGQAGALPSPVYGSSPGFSPLLNALLASGRALEQGIPDQYSMYLTQRYAPDTINGTPSISRTA